MNPFDVVPPARQVDDPLRRSLAHQRHQQRGEQEMAKVIGPELRLETIGGAAERAGHDPRVVDQQVDLAEALVGLGPRGTNAGKRGEVARERFHAGAGSLHDMPGRGLQLGRVAARQDQAGAPHGHRPRGLLAQPGIAARDERGAPGQVHIAQDLVRRARRAEMAHRSFSRSRNS
jgi:hypothetical protein